MATAGWRTDRPLNQLITEHHGRFNVYQLVRLLNLSGGQDTPVRIQFQADLSAAFPGREITKLNTRKTINTGHGATQIFDLATPNYSIASTLGPLPETFTEWVREQERSGQRAMPAFLNIFNNRLNLLRHHIQGRQQLGLGSVRPGDTPHAHFLAALAGLALPELQRQVPLRRRAWLGMAGLLANCRHSAVVVSQIISLYLNRPVELVPLVGARRMIEPGDRLILGSRHNSALGQHAIGEARWDPQAAIRLNIGGLDYQTFGELLPQYHAPVKAAAPSTSVPSASTSHRPLRNGTFLRFAALVRLLLDRRCDCDIELTLQAEAQPAPRLTTRTQEGQHYLGLRLGHSAWIGRVGHAPRLSARYRIPAFGSLEVA